MKNAMKKLLSLTLAVMLLLSVAPFQAFAATNEYGEMVFSEEFEAPATNKNTSTSQTADEPRPVVDNDADSDAGSNTATPFALPDGCKPGDAVNIYFNVDGSIMKKVSAKVGDSFPSLPSGSDALKFFGTTNGTSDGYAFKCWSWKYYDIDEAVDSKDIVSANGLKVGGNALVEDNDHDDSKGNPVSPDAKGNTVYKMEVYAVFKTVKSTTNVKLDLKSGKLKPGVSDTIAVTIGEEYPELPTPIRSGYTFLRWEVIDTGSTAKRDLSGGTDRIVYSTARPYAVWQRENIKVQVDWYDLTSGVDENGWVAFSAQYEEMDIPAGNKLSTSDGTFPTEREIKALDLGGYTLNGWKFKKTGNEFKPDSTVLSDKVIAANAEGNVVEIVPKLQRKVWLIAQHPTKNTLANAEITVEIGTKIGTKIGTEKVALTAPASWAADSDEYDGFTFTQWVGKDGEVISTRENLKDTSKHPEFYPGLVSSDDHSSRYNPHFDAQWVVSKVVQLYFHVDGKTSTYAWKTSCYDIPAEGSFNMHSLNLYKYFPNYSKYDDGVDVAYGWYTDAQWKNYCTGKPASTVCDELWNVSDTKDLQELHIMLIDKGTDSNKYNNNNKTADKTNPKTGDIIMAAVAILVVSGAALAGIYYLTKKKRGTK